jgi:hypothetical protein
VQQRAGERHLRQVVGGVAAEGLQGAEPHLLHQAAVRANRAR